VIEDDAETAEQLVDCLRTHGYAVDLSMMARTRRKDHDRPRLGCWPILVLATAVGISTSRRSVARIEAINATREIIETGLRRRIPVRTGNEWDGLAKNLARCSTVSRIWMRPCELFLTAADHPDRDATGWPGFEKTGFSESWSRHYGILGGEHRNRLHTGAVSPTRSAQQGGIRRLPRLRMTGEGMSKRISLVTTASLAIAMGLRVSDGWAQYYIGAQAGWTGLPYQTDTIDGLGSVPVQFTAGYNVGVRGGYQLGPWRFEEEYSHRHNDLAEYDEITNGVSGNRHTHSITTNVLYDFTTGWPITPHIGVGIGAMNLFDGVRVPGSGQVFSDRNWQFGYQAIAGLRYDINPILALDVDFRYMATTESTFSIPNTSLRYRTGANTNNFVASVTYRFGPSSPTSPFASPAPPLP
jgi:opacity protein-like surface antigen